MGELPNFTGDNESSEKKSETSKDKQARWVPPPLAPRSFGLHREMFSMSRNPLESGKSDDEEAEADVDTEKPVAQTDIGETTHSETASAEEFAEASPTDAPELSPDTSLTSEVLPLEGASEEQPYSERPDEGVLHIRGGNMQPYPESPLTTYTEAKEDKTPIANNSTPPPPTPSIPGMSDQMPTPNWNTSPQQTPGSERLSDAVPAAQISAEQHKTAINETEYYAEKRGLRRGLVAGFITGYVVKAYLARRKSQRYEKAATAQLEKRDEQIARLQREQWQQNERLTAQVEQESRRRQEQMAPAPQVRPESPIPKVAEAALKTANPKEQLFDQEGNEITLQPGWRVERSAGGYSVVLDEHNRIVHNAIHYGEAFKHDQKREQLSDDLLAVLGSGPPVSSQSDATGMGALPMPAPQQSQLGDLPGQHPSADLNHRLPKPHSQIKAAATSPWLWTAIAVLIIVYFIAQLA